MEPSNTTSPKGEDTVETKRQHFNSIHEFYRFITETPVNSVFAGKSYLASQETGASAIKFRGTASFQEASSLMHNGWSEMAKEIDGRLRTEIKSIKNQTSRRSVYDVVGGQASVPRYLQGVPTNMVNQKTVIKRQKVVTINKNIGYNCNVKKETMIQESIKALKIIREIEASGTRVNLNIVWTTTSGNETIIMSVRIKSAGERLNIAKMAFPLVHPSMLRRIAFRYIETSKLITEHSFTYGYGRSEDGLAVSKHLPKDEIFLPSFIPNPQAVVDQIKK